MSPAHGASPDLPGRSSSPGQGLVPLSSRVLLSVLESSSMDQLSSAPARTGAELGISVRHCRLLAAAPRQDVVFVAIVRARSLGRWELSPCLGSRDRTEGGLGFHSLCILFLRTYGVRRLVCHFAWSCGASRDRRHSQPSSGRWAWARGAWVEWRSPRRRRCAARTQRTLRMWV